MRALRQDQSGVSVASSMVGAIAMILVIGGVTSTMLFLLRAQIDITAATSVSTQMNQATSALRSDVTLAGNIPARTAEADRVEFIIPGHQNPGNDNAGCRLSIWEVDHDEERDLHQLVNREEIYSATTFAQPSEGSRITPYSTAGASICTGELVNERETVYVNDTGSAAGFAYFNGRGNELDITHGETIQVAVAGGDDFSGMGVAERAAQTGTQIEGVRFSGMVAESDERGLGRELSIHAVASTLEHKDVEDAAFGSDSVFLDDMTLQP